MNHPMVKDVLREIVCYPLYHARMLMQLGYGPVPPTSNRALLSSGTVLCYPNVLSYMRFLIQRDGLLTLWRGFVLSYVKSKLQIGICQVSDQLLDILLNGDDMIPQWSAARGGRTEVERFIVNWSLSNWILIQETASHVISLTITYPLQVVLLRQMAETMQQDATRGFFSMVWHIYQNEGVMAFFSGLTPYILYHGGIYLMSSNLSFLVHVRSTLNDDTLDYMLEPPPVYDLLSGFVLYPLEVAATVMAVPGLGMKAAKTRKGGLLEYLIRLMSSRQFWNGLSYYQIL